MPRASSDESLTNRRLSVSRRTMLKTAGVGAVGLAGCTGNSDGGGSSDGDDGSSDGTSVGNENGMTTTIKMGTIVPLTGPFSVVGKPMRNANQLALEQAKAEGDIDDFEHIVGDSKTTPSTGRQLAQEFINDEGVDVLGGAASDAVSLSISRLAQRENVLHLSRGTDLKINFDMCLDNIFRYAFNLPIYLEGSVGYALRNDLGSTVYQITQDFSWATSMSAVAKNKTIPELGGEHVGESVVPISSTDYSGPLTEAKNSGADIIHLNSFGSGLIAGLNQTKDFGILDEGTVITVTDDNRNQAAGLDPEVHQYENYFRQIPWHHSIETEATQQFAKDYFDRFGGMVTLASTNFAGVRSFLKTFGEVGSTDLDTIVPELEGQELVQLYETGEHWRECDHLATFPAVTAKGVIEEESGDLEGLTSYYDVVAVNDDERLFFPCEQTNCGGGSGPDWYNS